MVFEGYLWNLKQLRKFALADFGILDERSNDEVRREMRKVKRKIDNPRMVLSLDFLAYQAGSHNDCVRKKQFREPYQVTSKKDFERIRKIRKRFNSFPVIYIIDGSKYDFLIARGVKRFIDESFHEVKREKVEV